MVNVLTFDVETTHIHKESGGTTALPYFGNRLVSIGYKWLWGNVHYQCYYHSEREPDTNAFETFQRELDHADVVVGQNIKFDLSWIRECGFIYEGHVYDTMVGEYVLSRSQRWPLSLAALAEKYSDVQKEKDLVAPYFKEGKTFYDIPWEIIETYGKADVISTEQVALAQLNAFGTTFEELFDEQPNTLAHFASVA